MNYSHSQDDKSTGTRAKALAFVVVVGFVALTANRMIVAPSESSTSGTSLSAASEMAVTTAAPATLYPALAADAAQDENGHPPSF